MVAQSYDCGSDCTTLKDITAMKKTLLLLFIVTLFGCSRQSTPDGLPKLVSVTLTVTQDGAPLTGAVVSLIDPSGGAGFSVGGTTDAAGKVAVYTHGKYKGAPLGKFKVRVTKTESDPIPSAPKTGTPEYAAYAREMSKNPPKRYTLIEKQYTRPETTPLELDITGPMTQSLDVGKTVKEVI
jgi:hypothetical protein